MNPVLHIPESLPRGASLSFQLLTPVSNYFLHSSSSRPSVWLSVSLLKKNYSCIFVILFICTYVNVSLFGI